MNDGTLAARITKGRPLVMVTVRPCDLEISARRRLHGAAPDDAVRCRGIISTAAAITSVSIDVLESLGLVRNIVAESDQGYCVSLSLESLTGEPFVIRRALVVSHTAESSEYPVIIGADQLRSLRFTIDGPSKGFDLQRV